MARSCPTRSFLDCRARNDSDAHRQKRRRQDQHSQSSHGTDAKSDRTYEICGHDLQSLPAHARFHLGLGYVPEERRIVPALTVRENLEIGLLSADVPIEMGDAIDQIARNFPRLKERLSQKGTTLSGGEQQMLAIARAMISKPRMLLSGRTLRRPHADPGRGDGRLVLQA